MNSFSGDPYITIGANGATLHFIGGQPVMDQGVINHALISLFTRNGWAGNYLFNEPAQQIGSDFLDAASQPITLKALTDIEQAAERALKSPLFGRVQVTARNPISDRIAVEILLEPPGGDIAAITLTRNGLNWQAQAKSPAYEKVN